MNEVYLSGEVDSVSALHHAGPGKAHLMLHMCVSHQNRDKKVKRERYAVHAWNSLAVWASQAVKPGMPMVVHGYLTQRALDGGIQVEVTAKRLFPG